MLRTVDPATGEITEIAPLSDSEREALARCESDIQEGLYKAWRALKEIHDKKLYRETGTFAAYCETRWGFSERRGYQLIDAASLVDEICTTGTDFQLNERTARALMEVPAEQRIPVLLTAHAASGGKVDSAWIKDSAKVQATKEATGGLVDDGEGGMTAATAAVIEERHERLLRQRQHIRDAAERDQGLKDHDKYQGQFTVVSVDAKRGFVTLIAPELAQALEAGQKGTYIVYIRPEAKSS